MQAVIDWLKNPVNFVIWWPIFTGLASIVYRKLDGYPRTHAVFSFLASLGLDLPKLLDMLRQLFTGQTAAQRAMSKAANTVTIVGGTLLMVLALSTASCKQVDSAISVIDKVVQVVKTDLEAGKTDEQLASDVCAALGGSATTDAVCGGVTFLIQDAIAILIDTGALSASGLVHAREYEGRHPAVAR